MQRRGFTLIELLVVVAIIGVLASVVMVSLNSARLKARNVKRVSDIKELLNAFSISLSSNLLPVVSDSSGFACVSVSCDEGWNFIKEDSNVDTFLLEGIPTKPSDPIGGSRGFGGYIYNSNFNASLWYVPNDYYGNPLPIGPVIIYLIEPPLTNTSCGPGRVWVTTTNYIECVVYVQ